MFFKSFKSATGIFLALAACSYIASMLFAGFVGSFLEYDGFPYTLFYLSAIAFLSLFYYAAKFYKAVHSSVDRFFHIVMAGFLLGVYTYFLMRDLGWLSKAWVWQYQLGVYVLISAIHGLLLSLAIRRLKANKIRQASVA